MISSSPDIVYSTPLGDEAQEDCIPSTPPTTTTKRPAQRTREPTAKSSRPTRQSSSHRTSITSRHQQPDSEKSDTENDPPPLPPPLNLTASEDELPPGMRDSSINTRQNHPKTKIQVLEKWFYDHLEYPYPTEREKEQLLEAAQMNKRQLENWFINGEDVLPQHTSAAVILTWTSANCTNRRQHEDLNADKSTKCHRLRYPREGKAMWKHLGRVEVKQ